MVHSGWDSSCQCRGHGFNPWSGKIPHAEGQLSLWAATTEACELRAGGCNKRATEMRSLHTTTKSTPHLPQLERALAQQWRPSATKNKSIKNSQFLLTYLLLYLLGALSSLQAVSSLVRNWTCALCSESRESYALGLQGIPYSNWLDCHVVQLRTKMTSRHIYEHWKGLWYHKFKNCGS